MKWTVVLFLSFISMTAANAFCIYRALNPEGCEDYLNHISFQASLFKGLFDNPMDRGRHRSTPGCSTVAKEEKHVIYEAPRGSRSKSRTRRHNGVCRHSHRGKSHHACAKCYIPLHPKCFADFHKCLEANPKNVVKPDNFWYHLITPP